MVILRWIFNALALLIVARLLPGIEVDSLLTALAAAVMLGLANAIIRPFILLFTLPINLLTLGLFTFVVNAFMLWLVAEIVKGFTISSFTAALEGAILLWLISMATNILLNREG